MKQIMVVIHKKTDIERLVNHGINLGYKIEERVKEILKDRESFGILCFGCQGYILPYLSVTGYKIIKEEEFLQLIKEDIIR